MTKKINNGERDEFWKKIIPIELNQDFSKKTIKDKWWINEKSQLKGKYPIYIISYNRSDACLTYYTFRELGLEDFKVVVEPCEKNLYLKYIPEKYLIITPEDFHLKGCGSVPVRNFVWEHSIKNNNKKHWIFDDNIRGFFFLTKREKKRCIEPNVFGIVEHFFDQFKNLGLAGFNYMYFVIPAPNRPRPSFFYNTRIYSAILINNDLQFRWRGKYNEDTDLSLRVLEAGFSTILLNTFSVGKCGTMIMKGGNEAIYKETNKREEFVDELIKQHPTLVKKVYRYNRWHHSINYNIYNNPLELKEDFSKLVYKDTLILKDRMPTPSGKRFGHLFRV